MANERIIPCEACRSEGRILRGQYDDERDCGPCPRCEGTGGEMIETQSVDLEDMQPLSCSDCGQHLPLLYPCFQQGCPLDKEIEPLREAMTIFADDANWRLNGPLDPNSAKFRGTKIARDALLNVSSSKLRVAVELVIATFEKDEAQGYRSKDRQFAISILGAALSRS